MVIFKLWGIPFIVVGLYQALGKFVHRQFLLKRTVYMVTTQKILRRRNKKVDMMQGFSLPQMSVKEHPDGLKSINFGDQPSIWSNSRGRSSAEVCFALEYLSDADRALYAVSSMRSGYAQQ